MKRLCIGGGDLKHVGCHYPHKLNCSWLLVILLHFVLTVSEAQVKQLIQVKTFNEQLQPMNNVELSINGKDFISTGNKGVVFIELTERDLPIKTIVIKNEEFEPSAWNHSKGTLEVVVRKKNYHIVNITVRNQNNTPVTNTAVTFYGKKPIQFTTDSFGRISMPLSLDEHVTSANQLAVKGYDNIGLRLSDNDHVLIVEKPSPIVPAQKNPLTANATEANSVDQDYFKDFDLSKLDSIQSLTVFYAVFKNVEMKSLSSDVKEKLDSKFNELVAQLQSPIQLNNEAFIGKISDSSFVADDIKNLLNQATTENRTLLNQRSDFDEKIRIINEKLELGIGNLDAPTRAALLSDLVALERLLSENESRFYRNVNDYRQIINSLKERYFDFENLENKLSESEARLLEEQRIFRQRLIGISAIVIVFAILIVLLIYFSSKLRKQKQALVVANNEVKRINENLEVIVLDRTRMLEEANRELDTFLYRASHDLRSPVCSIMGLCNIAIHLSDGEPRELVKRVVSTTEGMDKLLKKLSIISEINQPSGYASIHFGALVEEVRRKFSNTIQANRIEVVIDCPSDIMFYSYPNLVEVVITNLFENALYFSVLQNPNRARVMVKASVEGNQLVFSIRDNGTGVDASIRHRLFDMFFKGHTDSKGSGLGLYIVQKSVQALEGMITVESEPGQYTEFFVKLPLQANMNKALLPAVA